MTSRACRVSIKDSFSEITAHFKTDRDSSAFRPRAIVDRIHNFTQASDYQSIGVVVADRRLEVKHKQYALV
jgi:ElaB/YqjD/DUF883 family membrane-anchored ribosome-binding protein